MVISEMENKQAKKQKQRRGIEKEIDIAILNRIEFKQRPEGDGFEETGGEGDAIFEWSFLERKKSKCKSFEAGVCLMYSRNSKMAVKADLVRAKVIGDEVGRGNRSCRTCGSLYRIWILYKKDGNPMEYFEQECDKV